MDINKIRDLVKEAQALHKEFQKGFLRVYSLSSSGDFGELREVLSELYGIIDKKFDVASQIGKASSLLGGDFEGFVKELQKNEHQMKFLLEELLLLVETPKMSFTEKAKINASLQRLLLFSFESLAL